MRTKSVNDRSYSMRLVDPCDQELVARTRQTAPDALLLHVDAKGRLELVPDGKQAVP